MVGIDRACFFKMAVGQDPNFACLWTETDAERGQYPAILTEQACLIKDW